MNQLYISLVLGLLILLAITAFLQRDLIFSQSQKHFLIVGPSYSGKTSLFHLLTTSTLPKYTPVLSQSVNEITNYKLPTEGLKESYVLRDYPGHSKLLNLFLYKDLKDKNFLKNVKGIIFVIDSTNINEFETGRMLYEILLQTEYLPNGVDILIACNKQDLFQSKPVFKIKELLELELNKLRVNSIKNLNKVDVNDEEFVDDDRNNFLQSVDKFSFDQLEGNFDFIEGSILKQKIDKWECWIAERGVN